MSLTHGKATRQRRSWLKAELVDAAVDVVFDWREMHLSKPVLDVLQAGDLAIRTVRQKIAVGVALPPRVSR